jgi:FkbM family methyltransferase
MARMFRTALQVVQKQCPNVIVKAYVRNRSIFLPWTHNLPSIVAEYPSYESEIPKLATHIHTADGRLCMIDVGANVGDTILSLPPLKNAKFLCIEASRHFFDVLQLNLGDHSNVTLECCLLTDLAARRGALVENHGTGHVEATFSAEGEPEQLNTTLDGLICHHPEFAEVNFLKVDTDGYDLRVLLGAQNLLKTARPCIHVEFSPRHWRNFGGCDVAEGIQLLCELGYENLLVYDNVGYPICCDSAVNPSRVSELLAYADEKPGFYLNIVAFNRSRRDFLEFASKEMSGVHQRKYPQAL